jgi:hypothetical protein
MLSDSDRMTDTEIHTMLNNQAGAKETKTGWREALEEWLRDDHSVVSFIASTAQIGRDRLDAIIAGSQASNRESRKISRLIPLKYIQDTPLGPAMAFRENFGSIAKKEGWTPMSVAELVEKCGLGAETGTISMVAKWFEGQSVPKTAERERLLRRSIPGLRLLPAIYNLSIVEEKSKEAKVEAEQPTPVANGAKKAQEPPVEASPAPVESKFVSKTELEPPVQRYVLDVPRRITTNHAVNVNVSFRIDPETIGVVRSLVTTLATFIGGQSVQTPSTVFESVQPSPEPTPEPVVSVPKRGRGRPKNVTPAPETPPPPIRKVNFGKHVKTGMFAEQLSSGRVYRIARHVTRDGIRLYELSIGRGYKNLYVTDKEIRRDFSYVP